MRNGSPHGPSGTHGIRVLGRDLTEFPSEDQVVSLGTERDRHPPSQEDKGEQIAILSNDAPESACEPQPALTRPRPRQCAARAREIETHLFTAIKEERVGVHPVRRGATEPGDVVEDQRRQGRVAGKGLMNKTRHGTRRDPHCYQIYEEKGRRSGSSVTPRGVDLRVA